jgi:hypothetical protein
MPASTKVALTEKVNKVGIADQSTSFAVIRGHATIKKQGPRKTI